MDGKDLFVFAGAGVSLSAPTCLPIFCQIRDEVLIGLGLSDFVRPTGREGASEKITDDKIARQVETAEGLAPEPFLHALAVSQFPLTAWLADILGPVDPNAVHVALARLASAGARIWTVNYDQNIEKAIVPNLTVCAWPAEPVQAQIMKPHGSLGGDLIATSDQVVRGLDATWLEQLRRDLVGIDTVVFVGYSGWDLDFHPYWDEVLVSARRVLWFDRPGHDRAFKESLLPKALARGALEIPDATPLPLGLSIDTSPNPSWDFLGWCHDEGLLGAPDDQARMLFAEKVDRLRHAALPGDVRWARAAVLGLMGSYGREREQYATLLRSPGQAKAAAFALGNHWMSHGRMPVAYALRGGSMLPPVSARLRGARERAVRKRLTVLSRVGAHTAVIKATNELAAGAVSTYDILRAESLRITGSLDEAAATADRAYRQALTEGHLVRIAHAAYQQCQALVWADRTDEARDVLTNRLRTYAPLAASRWVGWADFLEAALLVRRGELDKSRHFVGRATRTFQAEALADGIVSAQMVLPTIERRAGDDEAFARVLGEIRAQMEPKSNITYYTRGHPFTEQALMLEEAEFARTHSDNLNHATDLFTALTGSAFPLHAAFGRLGLAMMSADGVGGIGLIQHGLAEEAFAAGTLVGQQLIVERATLLLAGDPAGAAELFYC